MKKAEEYAGEYNANPTNETLLVIAQSFVREVSELAKTRGAKSHSARAAILDEQDRKWKAFARRTVGINPDGFVELIKDQFQEMYVLWRGPLSQAARKACN